MGRPKKHSGAVADAVAPTAPPTKEEIARECFVDIQALSKQWYEKEREGIALIENFQTALLACRPPAAPSTSSDAAQRAQRDGKNPMAAFMDGDEELQRMDPLLAEDLYAQIKELPAVFTELLAQMSELHKTVKEQIVVVHDEDGRASDSNPLILTAADYLQFLGHEVGAFESEFQHVEALLAMMTFAITTDQLRTLVISWSTSPFLDLDRSREFRQRHEQSQQLRTQIQ